MRLRMASLDVMSCFHTIESVALTEKNLRLLSMTLKPAESSQSQPVWLIAELYCICSQPVMPASCKTAISDWVAENCACSRKWAASSLLRTPDDALVAIVVPDEADEVVVAVSLPPQASRPIAIRPEAAVNGRRRLRDRAWGAVLEAASAGASSLPEDDGDGGSLPAFNANKVFARLATPRNRFIICTIRLTRH